MPTFVVLVNFTAEGRRNITDISGLDAAKHTVEALGGQWIAWYLTKGQYDAVVIVDAPDDDTVNRIARALNIGGGVRSQTLRVFTEDEFRQLAGSLQAPP